MRPDERDDPATQTWSIHTYYTATGKLCGWHTSKFRISVGDGVYALWCTKEFDVMTWCHMGDFATHDAAIMAMHLLL